MSLAIPLPDWIIDAEVSQYSSADDIAKSKIFDTVRVLSPNYNRLLYIVRDLVEWQYNNAFTTVVVAEVRAFINFDVSLLTPTPGRTLGFDVVDPVLGGINLAQYTEVGGDTTVPILTAHLKTALAANPYGYTIGGDTTHVLITAPVGQGATTNGAAFDVYWFMGSLATQHFAGGVTGSTTTTFNEAYFDSLTSTGLFMKSLIYSSAAAIAGGGGCVSPLITTNPVSQTKTVGGSVTFTVVATGTGTLTYQWQKDLANITGATSASYTDANVQLGDAGSYRCIVSNACGNTPSASATLTVNAAMLTAYWFSTDVDPYPTIHGGSDPYSYTNTYLFNHNAFSLFFPLAPADQNKFIIFKVPAGEPIKLAYFNTSLNSGTIPGPAFWNQQTVGSFNYYITRAEFAFDESATTNLNSA